MINTRFFADEEEGCGRGCISSNLMYAICCNRPTPKAIYRQVTECNEDVLNSFTTSEVESFCNN